MINDNDPLFDNWKEGANINVIHYRISDYISLNEFTTEQNGS